MYTLSNDSLAVSILDPVADRDRMGPRYCTGGYIFQVEDANGPLLSGPTYPESFNWYDGQGIPDSFAQGALRDPAQPTAEALVPGIGLCRTDTREVVDECEWNVTPEGQSISFGTSHEWGDYGVSVHRSVRLAGRVIASTTSVANHGSVQVPIRWFPHPFYPLPRGDAICSIGAHATIPEGTTYCVGSDGYLRCNDLDARQAVAVRCDGGAPFTVLMRHPSAGLVAAVFSFAPAHLLVWGNPNTFSFEPYLEQSVGRGMSLGWSVEYHF